MNPRLRCLRPYPFERLRDLLAGSRPPAGLAPIVLSIGEPRHAAPPFIGEALTAALTSLGTYPLTLGAPELRAAIARWLEGRFSLPPGRQVRILGSSEYVDRDAAPHQFTRQIAHKHIHAAGFLAAQHRKRTGMHT